MNEPMIYANLLHLSYNMWGDWDRPKRGPHWAAQPQLRFDEKLWNDLLVVMQKRGLNMVVIDLGDGVDYASHPEIAVKGAWSRDKLKAELTKLRQMGLEPIPKLNFSTCHDQWLGPYARMVSTPQYYKVCEDLIAEAIELFDKPRFFHLGMDEEEAVHQVGFEYAVMRQHGLWWRDIEFFFKQVEAKGVRPWIWGDYVWNHADVFYKNMPKNVMQSNWYREPVRGDAKSVYGGVFNMDIECVRTFVEVDKAGFDQIPTVSNWETPANISGTMRFCREHVSKERLKGFFLTPWKPTVEAARERHMDAIEHFALEIAEVK
ncbi:MAG: Tat pathway signal protein [Tepidisphaeraceae bacterium]